MSMLLAGMEHDIAMDMHIGGLPAPAPSPPQRRNCSGLRRPVADSVRRGPPRDRPSGCSVDVVHGGKRTWCPDIYMLSTVSSSHVYSS
jgi:hypothetical protein